MTGTQAVSDHYQWTGGETVGVFLGGPSAEREVSLRSGAAVAEAFRQRGNEVLLLDPRDRSLNLGSRIDVAFLALHGEFGEDGQIQSLLERERIPYTGCDSYYSQVAIDKAASKECFVRQGLPTPKWTLIDSLDASLPEALSLPVIVKPNEQGSTIGLQIVRSPEEWQPALEAAFQHGERQVVEEMVSGRELTVGILDGLSLPVVEICPKQGIYDYSNKYTKGACRYFCPAELPQDLTGKIQEVALAAFQSIGEGPYGRVDIILAEDATPYLLEVNTLPGMTETSLLPMAAAALGISFQDLCIRLAELAMDRFTQNPG